jgi:hypothetical protein
MAAGHLSDGLVGGVDVALQAAQRAVAAQGLDEGDVLAGLGQVREPAVAQLVQGPAAGCGFEGASDMSGV